MFPHVPKLPHQTKENGWSNCSLQVCDRKIGWHACIATLPVPLAMRARYPTPYRCSLAMSHSKWCLSTSLDGTWPRALNARQPQRHRCIQLVCVCRQREYLGSCVLTKAVLLGSQTAMT